MTHAITAFNLTDANTRTLIQFSLTQQLFPHSLHITKELEWVLGHMITNATGYGLKLTQ